MSEKSEKDLKEKQEETVEATPQEQASAETTVEAEEPTAEEKLQKELADTKAELEKSKKEYMFLNRNTIGVIDGSKFYMLAKKLHLQNDFERFMIDDTREDLKHWCFRNHVSQNDLKNCMKYVENVGDRSEDKGKLQVMTCITDPYGNPYVPGSSLKGMLRTILLSRDILQNREKYRTDTRQLRSDLEVNRINRRILNNIIKDKWKMQRITNILQK